MNKNLRKTFEKNKKQFFEFALDDLYGQVPSKVSDPGLRVLQEQREKVDRWLMWQAYVLQRRMLYNPKEAPLLMGMLLQIKILSFALSGGVASDGKTEGTSSAAKARADRERVQKEQLGLEIKGVEAFKKGKKK